MPLDEVLGSGKGFLTAGVLLEKKKKLLEVSKNMLNKFLEKNNHGYYWS